VTDLIEIVNINKTYETGNKALRGINITIEDGEFVFIMGKSGSGKSTLLHLLLKEVESTSGSIVVNHMNLQKMPRRYVPKYRRTLGVVFQDFRLLRDRNVFENVAFAQRVVGASSRAIRESVPEMLKLVGLSAKYKSLPHQLSGGEQQRVAIARALVKKPDILLLDEPLSNLDARLRLQTRDEIKRIQQRTGITTVFVTHDQEESLTICDEIVLMKNGALQQYGPPQSVFDYPENQFVAGFLGSPPINLIDGEIRDGQLFLDGKRWRKIPGNLENQKVKAGIRAENIRIAADQEEEGFPATAIAISKLGGMTTVTAQLANGSKIKLYQDLSSPIMIDEEIRLKVTKDATMLFEGSGGKILQW